MSICSHKPRAIFLSSQLKGLQLCGKHILDVKALAQIYPLVWVPHLPFDSSFHLVHTQTLMHLPCTLAASSCACRVVRIFIHEKGNKSSCNQVLTLEI